MLALACVALLVPSGALAAAPCAVPTLSAERLARGAAEVREYRRKHERMHARDLMGYRDGPRLGRPSRRERTSIAYALDLRRDFGLSASRLLVRRLLRDHRKRIDRSLATPLTPLEADYMRYRDRLGERLGGVDEYGAKCAPDEIGGVYLADKRRGGAYVGVGFTRDLDRHRAELRRRYVYADALELRLVPYSGKYLAALAERISDESALLERQGIDVTTIGVDESRNRVEVGLRNPTPRARRLLGERYGAAVLIDPEPAGSCTLVGCSSQVAVEIRRLPPTARRARICAAGRCAAGAVGKGPALLRVRLPKCKRNRRAVVEVSLEVFEGGGRRLRYTSRRVRPKRSQPNGRGCGPVCWSRALRYRGDTGSLRLAR